jgi:hypothetical protein
MKAFLLEDIDRRSNQTATALAHERLVLDRRLHDARLHFDLLPRGAVRHD